MTELTAVLMNGHPETCVVIAGRVDLVDHAAQTMPTCSVAKPRGQTVVLRHVRDTGWCNICSYSTDLHASSPSIWHW